MKRFLKILIIAVTLILSACQTSAETQRNEAEQLLNDLMKSVSAPTLERIKDVIQTDLQFNRGCREQGIEIKVCDFKNSLDVEFREFDCKERRASEKELLDPNRSIMDFKRNGAVCSYQAHLNWPDGKTEKITISDEKYEFGIVYMDELVVEHGWQKVLSQN